MNQRTVAVTTPAFLLCPTANVCLLVVFCLLSLFFLLRSDPDHDEPLPWCWERDREGGGTNEHGLSWLLQINNHARLINSYGLPISNLNGKAMKKCIMVFMI